MSLLSNFFKRDPAIPEVKGLSISHGMPDATGFILRPQNPDADADTAGLQDVMKTNELVYACLNIKAQSARDPRLTVEVRNADNEYEALPTHPLQSLMRSPNERMTEGDLLTAAIVSWDTTSPRLFFAEKEYQRSLLVGLHPLNPALMTPIRSGVNRVLTGWRWGSGGESIDYKIEELLIRSAPGWYQPSPLVAALGSIESDTGQTDYVRDFFANGGMPSVYIKDEERMLNQPQRDQARAIFAATYSNRGGGQHSVLVLDKSQSVGKIGAGLDELDSESLRMITESRICMVLGVPPLIVYAYAGLMRSTYSNLREAWSGFWDATMSPTLKEWRDFWALTLLPEFEDRADIRSEKVRLRYDLSQVAALQDDVDAVQARAVKAYTAGIVTLNEARVKIGEKPDPTPAGDMYRRAAAPVAAPVRPDTEEDSEL